MSRSSCDSRHAFQGMRALVTGANGGLGMALVEALLKRGAARVYAASRSGQPFADPRVVPIRLDITDSADVEQARRCAGDITLLVNNAGVNANQPLLGALDVAGARQEMETNYFGTLAMCRAFAPQLRAQGGGTIVNVLSAAARLALPGMGSLCASKAAALQMTECLRAELRSSGIQVVSFLPGALDTRMSRHLTMPKGRVEEAAVALLDGLCEGLGEIAFSASSTFSASARCTVAGVAVVSSSCTAQG